MGRGWFRLAGLGLAAILLLASHPAYGFIERKVLLKDLLKDCEHVFLARVESVDPARPGMILKVETDYKGKVPVRRLAINLTGDKENHTPLLLKRVAPELPIVCFNVFEKNQHMLLAYTNGTWFQVLGTPDGDRVRWAFTHCEIYLRRTYKGPTAELQQIVVDALAGKKEPPGYDAKAKPDVGPEIEAAPADPKPTEQRMAVQCVGRGSLLLGVIALPFLMPIAALLQLLFPGLLRDQWRSYQIAISVLLTQSTIIFLGMLLRYWMGPLWWLTDQNLWIATVLVAWLGLGAAVVRRLRMPTPASKPVRVEFIALGSLIVAGIGWASYQYFRLGEQPFTDEMGVVVIAAVLGMVHLGMRCVGGSRGETRPTFLTTEIVFLFGLSSAGVALGGYLFGGRPANVETHAITSDWVMARGNPERTGSLDPTDRGPTNPRVLWTFDPAEVRGRYSFHSSPTVVDGLLYVGALRQVSALQDGYLFCIDAQSGEEKDRASLPMGRRLWRFSANDSLRPVFATPIVAGGRVYIGEGYHQDKSCRLFCLDARDGDRQLWAMPTTSHVESSPCVVGSRVYFGAGDDGLLCVDTDQVEVAGSTRQPRLIWQMPGFHIDVSPLVVGDVVYTGSTVGDRHQDLYALAVSAANGQMIWQKRNELRITGSPAHADGRVFFGLGNGKLGEDADAPQGGVWCLNAADGKELWSIRTGNSVMATPALMNGKVLGACTDGFCYCLDQASGALVWKASMGAPIAASPVASGGKVFLLAVDGTLACLDAATGEQLWKLANYHGGDVDDAYASPVLFQGKLYVAVGGKVHCIGDG
jgi:outer membrane protein assembly factor BamB